jgi:hypothetical protein
MKISELVQLTAVCGSLLCMLIITGMVIDYAVDISEDRTNYRNDGEKKVLFLILEPGTCGVYYPENNSFESRRCSE